MSHPPPSGTPADALREDEHHDAPREPGSESEPPSRPAPGGATGRGTPARRIDCTAEGDGGAPWDESAWDGGPGRRGHGGSKR